MMEKMDKYNGPERRNGLNHLKELMEMKLESNERALELQAKEYERRLADLNGEADRLRNMQSTYLPRELCDSKYNLLRNKVESLEKLVYVGLGGVLVLQMLLHFFK